MERVPPLFTVNWSALTLTVTVTVFGVLIVIKLLVSSGVEVAGTHVKLFIDISHVESEFQSPEVMLLKYSLAENDVPVAKKIIKKDKNSFCTEVFIYFPFLGYFLIFVFDFLYVDIFYK